MVWKTAVALHAASTSSSGIASTYPSIFGQLQLVSITKGHTHLEGTLSTRSTSTPIPFSPQVTNISQRRRGWNISSSQNLQSPKVRVKLFLRRRTLSPLLQSQQINQTLRINNLLLHQLFPPPLHNSRPQMRLLHVPRQIQSLQRNFNTSLIIDTILHDRFDHVLCELCLRCHCGEVDVYFFDWVIVWR